MDVMENKLRFDGRITRLIFPYGLLINGDGNTIYTVPYIFIFYYPIILYPLQNKFLTGSGTSLFGSNKSK